VIFGIISFLAGKIKLTQDYGGMQMNKAAKTFLTAAGVGTAFCATGVAIAAYNSRPAKTKRMVRRAGRTMESVGGMLTAMGQISK